MSTTNNSHVPAKDKPDAEVQVIHSARVNSTSERVSTILLPFLNAVDTTPRDEGTVSLAAQWAVHDAVNELLAAGLIVSDESKFAIPLPVFALTA